MDKVSETFFTHIYLLGFKHIWTDNSNYQYTI